MPVTKVMVVTRDGDGEMKLWPVRFFDEIVKGRYNVGNGTHSMWYSKARPNLNGNPVSPDRFRYRYGFLPRKGSKVVVTVVKSDGVLKRRPR